MSIISQRVAKDFDGVIYFGTVIEYITASDGQNALWNVHYDDGDTEDLDQQDVLKSLDMYRDLQDADNKGEVQVWV